MKKLLKLIIPNILHQPISKIYRFFYKRKIPVHVSNVFGFDLYQNCFDIIDYSSFKDTNIENLPNNLDTRVFQTIKKYVKKGSIAIDIGANIGLMSLVMSKSTGSNGKVLSFEPGPVSFGLLRRNVYSNKLHSNIVISDIAISDFNGTAPLFINLNGESDNQIHKNLDIYNFRAEAERPKFFVKTITIDSYLKRKKINFSDISFVKIDTQGHDLAVLIGGSSLFKNSKKIAVLCEFCPYLKAWEKQSIDEFYDILISFGFDVYDDSNLSAGIINVDYLKNNYGFDKIGKYTDLLLLKGLSP